MKTISAFFVVTGLTAGLHMATAGDITGTITLNGTPPPEKEIADIRTDVNCGKLHTEAVKTRFFVVGSKGELADVFVTLKGISGKSAGDKAEPIVIDQKGCEYLPYVTACQTGQKIVVKNSDPVLHNIHTYEIIGAVRRTMFNVGQPDKGDLKQPIKVRRANVIKVECDAHDFMHAWAFAADNPYAAVTKEDGSFSIDGLPDGDYELKAWHPVLGEKSATVKVGAGGTANAAFEFTK